MDSYYKNRLFDVVVIGAGISGLGIALEASSKGFETLVLERDRICGATSDNSLRVIHGGFRYLQNANILRVVESLQEQSAILKEAPSLVKLLPCVMPLARFGLKSRAPVEAATRFYNFLSENVTGQSNRAGIISQEFVEKHVQLLRGQAPHGALLWYDARLRDPQKFSALMQHKIDREGGEVLLGVSVTHVRKQDGVYIIKYAEGDETGEICSRTVVNAAGPWIETIACENAKRPKTKWCRAFNVLLNRKLQERFAVGGKSRSGRLFFAVPRADGTAIGTGYLPYDERSQSIRDEEVAHFVKDFNETFPNAHISDSDISGVEWGRMPVRKINDDGTKLSLYGRSRIWNHGGMIDVLSTKYTTFHAQGKRVLRTAIRYLR